MKTRFLTDSEKSDGLRYFNQFQMLNGFGFSFLGDTPVYLLALSFGASNIQLGYISSALFLAGIVLPLLPKLLAGKNIVKVHSTSWFFRGIVCLGYLGLFFLQGRSAVWLILLIYTLFCTIRTVGVAVFNPAVRMLSTSDTQGQIVSRLNTNFQSASLVSRVISFFVTSIESLSGVVGLVSMQMAGVLLNSLATSRLRKTPCREVISYRKGRGILHMFKDIMRDPHARPFVLQRWSLIATSVVMGLTIPFLKSQAGLTSSQVFLFAISITIANILSGYFVGFFADRMGSKPLLIVGTVSSAMTCLIWVLLPVNFPIVLLFILGFITMFLINTNNLLNGRLIIMVMPDEDTVGYNSMLNFVVAIISLILGVAAGSLIDIGPAPTHEMLNPYSWAYMIAVICNVASLFFGLRIRERGSLSSKDAASILLSIDGIRAYLTIGRLSKATDFDRVKAELMSISRNANDVATDEIRRMMASPLPREKTEIIKALFDHPRPALIPELIREAVNPDSVSRTEAVFALGAYPDGRVKVTLESLLHDADPRIRSNAAKSLGRIGDRESLDYIYHELYLVDTDVRERMNYIICLSHMDSEARYLLDTFSSQTLRMSRTYRQAVYSLYAMVNGMSPPLVDLYQKRNLSHGSGLREFIEESRDAHHFLEHYRSFHDLAKEEDAGGLVLLCAQVLEGEEPEIQAHLQIRQSILELARMIGSEEAAPDMDDALACVYLTYQIVKP